MKEEQLGVRKIERLKQTRVYHNPWVTLYYDEVLFPNGKAGHYNRLFEGRTGRGVVVVPIDAKKRFGLVHQYRYPTGTWEWEFPRGFSEPGQTPEQNALRELREETGLVAQHLEPLGVFYPNTGLLSTVVRAFLATRLRIAGGKSKHQGEIQSVKFVSRGELNEHITKGKIRDAFTLSCVSLMEATRLEESGR